MFLEKNEFIHVSHFSKEIYARNKMFAEIFVRFHERNFSCIKTIIIFKKFIETMIIHKRKKTKKQKSWFFLCEIKFNFIIESQCEWTIISLIY